MTTAEGVEIVLTLRPGHEPHEVRVVVEAPRSVVVARPERPKRPVGSTGDSAAA